MRMIRKGEFVKDDADNFVRLQESRDGVWDKADMASEARRVVVAVAHMEAAHARIEAMKAENMYRLSCGHSVAYGEEAFYIQADILEKIASDLEHA